MGIKMNNYYIDDIETFFHKFTTKTYEELLQRNIFVIGTHEIVKVTNHYFETLRKKVENEKEQFFTVESVNELKEVYDRRNTKKSTLFYLVADFQTVKNNDVESYVHDVKNQLCELKPYLMESKDNLLQLTSMIPEILTNTDNRENLISLAENEYYFYYKKNTGFVHSYVCELEDFLKDTLNCVNQIQCVRVDRIYGPGITQDLTGISEICKNVYENREVVLKQDASVFSCIYIQDAIFLIIVSLLMGKKGNVYHISSRHCSYKEISLLLYKKYSEQYQLRITDKVDFGEKKATNILNASKKNLIFSKDYKPKGFERTLINTFGWVNNLESHNSSIYNVYYNRMDNIRRLELEMLNEIDRICKKYDIKYFLTAGTMLGAVRHGGFIPWDDDVDIGILPEDYKKLQKVILGELNEKYSYQNCFVERTSHYIHDKIRLNNTYFSTRYSNKYEMKNGVYIDIFVYYKTSNYPLFQKLHISEVAFWRKVIGVRWSTRKPKRLIAKVCYFLIKLLPSVFYDYVYRSVCMKYQHRKTNYRIDGGFNLKKVGAFPNSWFMDTIPYTFEGKEYPILKEYDAYLSHWYSAKYNELPPLSSRNSVHDVKRIDLGQYLINPDEEELKTISLKGELY